MFRPEVARAQPAQRSDACKHTRQALTWLMRARVNPIAVVCFVSSSYLGSGVMPGLPLGAYPLTMRVELWQPHKLMRKGIQRCTAAIGMSALHPVAKHLAGWHQCCPRGRHAVGHIASHHVTPHSFMCPCMVLLLCPQAIDDGADAERV